MPLVSLSAWRGLLGLGQRLMGIDPGRRIIGLALSDAGLRFASPYGVLPRGRLRANADQIAAIARKENAGGLVIGCPWDGDGALGPAAQAVRDWARALSEKTGLPVSLWDESLSTAAVETFLIDVADLSRVKRQRAKDRAAAALILQQALDAMPPG